MSAVIAASLHAWYQRAHVRVCDRAPGTDSVDDLGAHAGCTCPARITFATVTEARERAAKGHAKYAHPGPPDACRSTHDVLCKAVW